MVSGPSAWEELKTRDNRSIRWTCETQDGRKGRFVIEGQKFDIAQGHMFLLDTSGTKIQVKQVDADLSTMPLDVYKVATQVPVVKKFFAASNNVPENTL